MVDHLQFDENAGMVMRWIRRGQLYVVEVENRVVVEAVVEMGVLKGLLYHQR